MCSSSETRLWKGGVSRLLMGSAVRRESKRPRVAQNEESPSTLSRLPPRCHTPATAHTCGQVMPSVLSTCCPPPARSEACPLCGGDRCSACCAPHRSTPGVMTCSCSVNALPPLQQLGYVHRRVILPPVVGIPVAVGVVDRGLLGGPRIYPEGRLVSIEYDDGVSLEVVD